MGGIGFTLQADGVRRGHISRAVNAPADVAECLFCGLMQALPAPVAGRAHHCTRCGGSFGRHAPVDDTPLALASTALVLFVLANTAPLMAITIAGRGQSTKLASGVPGLAQHGLAPLALFVFFIALAAPIGRVCVLAAALLLLRIQPASPYTARLIRLADRLRPWSMLDVFLIGALVALTKLHTLARIEIGVGFWALGALVVVLSAFEMSIGRRSVWGHVKPLKSQPATGHVDLTCRECTLVQAAAAKCVRCDARLQRRKPDSLHKAAALVITGAVLYLPANLYPVVSVVSFGRQASATILGGVAELMNGKDWPLALIVFTASVAVPLLKLLGLAWLLLSTKLKLRRGLVRRTRLFRLIDLVSRWSSVDVFVAALLTALVTLGNIATIEPGFGALSFGAVVLITMLATESFDPRLMWDAAGANDV